jgi:hypothetical protein
MFFTIFAKKNRIRQKSTISPKIEKSDTPGERTEENSLQY